MPKKKQAKTLSQAYFEKFHIRVEVLDEYLKRGAFSDVIRESQEALELFLKGVLRELGVEPTHSHDPGKELQPFLKDLPLELKPLASELVIWSKNLRKEREFAFYGAADFVPTEEYSREDAEGVIQFLKKVSKAGKKAYL